MISCKLLYNLERSRAISVLFIKFRPRPERQGDLLRWRLTDLINLRHVLVKLTTLIDGDLFELEWSGFFVSGNGRPAARQSAVGRGDDRPLDREP